MKYTAQWTGYAEDEEIIDYMNNWNDNLSMNEQKITFEEAKEAIYDDDFYWTNQWEDFCNYLDELMGKNAYWIDTAKNMGWRNLSGYKVFEADNAQKFIDAITPNNSEFSLYVNKFKYGFKIRISHHDAPMGEHHIVKPLSEKQFEKHQ